MGSPPWAASNGSSRSWAGQAEAPEQRLVLNSAPMVMCTGLTTPIDSTASYTIFNLGSAYDPDGDPLSFTGVYLQDSDGYNPTQVGYKPLGSIAIVGDNVVYTPPGAAYDNLSHYVTAFIGVTDGQYESWGSACITLVNTTPTPPQPPIGDPTYQPPTPPIGDPTYQPPQPPNPQPPQPPNPQPPEPPNPQPPQPPEPPQPPPPMPFPQSAPYANQDCISYFIGMPSQMGNATDLLANDMDSNGDPIHVVSVGNPEHGSFSLSGSVLTFTPDDWVGQFWANYTIADDHGNESSGSILVTVSDPNRPPEAVNNPPSISPQTFSIAENSADGTDVGTVSATDPDNDALTFSITAGNVDNAFEIQSDSGKIFVNNAAALDFETRPQFLLAVRVSDGINAPVTAQITINVTDVGPVIGEIGPQSTIEGRTVDFTIPVSGGTGELFASLSDSEELPPDWIVSGMKITTTNNGRVRYDTTEEASKSFNIVVTVTDEDGESAKKTIPWEIFNADYNLLGVTELHNGTATSNSMTLTWGYKKDEHGNVIQDTFGVPEIEVKDGNEVVDPAQMLLLPNDQVKMEASSSLGVAFPELKDIRFSWDDGIVAGDFHLNPVTMDPPTPQLGGELGELWVGLDLDLDGQLTGSEVKFKIDIQTIDLSDCTVANMRTSGPQQTRESQAFEIRNDDYVESGVEFEYSLMHLGKIYTAKHSLIRSFMKDDFGNIYQQTPGAQFKYAIPDSYGQRDYSVVFYGDINENGAYDPGTDAAKYSPRFNVKALKQIFFNFQFNDAVTSEQQERNNILEAALKYAEGILRRRDNADDWRARITFSPWQSGTLAGEPLFHVKANDLPDGVIFPGNIIILGGGSDEAGGAPAYYNDLAGVDIVVVPEISRFVLGDEEAEERTVYGYVYPTGARKIVLNWPEWDNPDEKLFYQNLLGLIIAHELGHHVGLDHPALVAPPADDTTPAAKSYAIMYANPGGGNTNIFEKYALTRTIDGDGDDILNEALAYENY